MKTKYTIIKHATFSHSFSGKLTVNTYELEEEYFSLPTLEEAIEELEEGNCGEEENWETDFEDFASDDDLKNEVKEYANIALASYDNTYII